MTSYATINFSRNVMHNGLTVTITTCEKDPLKLNEEWFISYLYLLFPFFISFIPFVPLSAGRRQAMYIQDPPKVMTVFQTAVLIRRSNFYRKCKVEMKEHMLDIVHKLCLENYLR
jgi:hypothetical protein